MRRTMGLMLLTWVFGMAQGHSPWDRTWTIPHIPETSTWRAELVLTNLASADRAARLTLMDHGAVLESFELEMAPGSCQAIPLSQGSCGLVETRGNRLHVDLVYALNAQLRVRAPLTTHQSDTLHLLFPTADDGDAGWRGLALMNPESQSAEADIIAIDDQGMELDRIAIHVPGGTRFKADLGSLFEGSESACRLRVDSSQPLSGLALVLGETPNLFMAEADPPALPLYSPLPEGGASNLVAYNLSSTDQRVQLHVCAQDEVTQSWDLVIPAGQCLRHPLPVSPLAGIVIHASESIRTFVVDVNVQQIVSTPTQANHAWFAPMDSGIDSAWWILNTGPKTGTHVVQIMGTDGVIDERAISTEPGQITELSRPEMSEAQTQQPTYCVITGSMPIVVTCKQAGFSATPRPVNDTPVLVTLYSHNEESWRSRVAEKQDYLAYRKHLLDRLHLIRDRAATMNWQSDWPVLEAIFQFDHDDVLGDTDGKNIAAYMHENLGFAVDPHGHLTTHTYADLAFMIERLGLPQPTVIGGCAALRCGPETRMVVFDDWAADIGLRSDGTIHGSVHPEVTWKPSILTVPAMPGHAMDEFSSGIWKPGFSDDFMSHDPDRQITYVGQGYPHDRTLLGVPRNGSPAPCAEHAEYIRELCCKIENAELPAGRCYTASLHFTDTDVVTSRDQVVLLGLETILDDLAPLQQQGDIRYVTYQQAAAIWNARRDRDPHPVLIHDFSMWDCLAQQARDVCGGSLLKTQFIINTHDWVWFDQSAATLHRLLDLHQQYRIPLDIYLTDPVFQAYLREAPDLLGRMKDEPLCAISYHIRPPSPYYWNFDFMDLNGMESSSRKALLESYETHALDLVTGTPSSTPGGFTGLTHYFGTPPYAVGGFSEHNPTGRDLATLFSDMGCQFLVKHTDALMNLGDRSGPLWLRPEHVEIKIYEYEGQPADQVLDSHLLGLLQPGATYVNIKIHENNFYSQNTPWWPVFFEDQRKTTPKSPPFDLDAWQGLVELKPETRIEAMWQLYEEMLSLVAANPYTFQPIHAPHLSEALGTTALN